MASEAIGMVGTAMPIILMLLVFYFLLYRPQKKEQERHRAIVDGLAVGDHVVTIGGLYGTVAALEAKAVRLKVADKVEIKIARAAVNANLTAEDRMGKT